MLLLDAQPGVRACGPGLRRHLVAQCHPSLARAATVERRPLLAPRVRSRRTWPAPRRMTGKHRVPTVSHRLDYGSHPGWRLIGGQVGQCEQLATHANCSLGTRFIRGQPTHRFSVRRLRIGWLGTVEGLSCTAMTMPPGSAWPGTPGRPDRSMAVRGVVPDPVAYLCVPDCLPRRSKHRARPPALRV